MNQTPFDLPLKLVTNALVRDSHGTCILGDSSARCTPEQAAYIVRAVNSHAALTAALALLVHGTMGYPALLEQYHSTDTCELPENCQHCYCVKQARAALTLAEGKEPQA